MWQTPKIDWTKDDYYNFTDLNRVEGNALHIVSMMAQIGQAVSISTTTNRDKKRIEFYDSLNRIEQNLQTLADNFYEPDGWQAVKTTWASLQSFDYRDANRLERNLLLLYDLLTAVLNNLRYCNQFTCGEEDLI